MHRECAYLRRGYRLPYKAKPRRLSEFLVIKMLEDENVRAGFINVADFEAAAALIKNEDTRDRSISIWLRLAE